MSKQSEQKIIFVTPYSSGARGNVTATKKMRDGYEQLGYTVSIFTYDEHDAD